MKKIANATKELAAKESTHKKPAKSNEKWLLAAVIISMFIWGTSWSSAKILSSYTDPLNLTFLRFLLVPLTLIPLTTFLKIDKRVNRKGWGYLAVTAALMLSYTFFLFQGLIHGLGGAAGVLITTISPIFAYVIGLIISRIVPRKREYFGLAVGVIAGCFLLNIWTNFESILDFGNGFFLISALVWASVSKVSSHSNRFGNAIGFNLWAHILVVIALFPFINYSQLFLMLQNADAVFWLNLLYFGVVNSALATTCFLFVAARIGAEKTSTFMFIVPSSAILASWVIMDEQILWYTVVGGILGLVAIIIINGKYNRRHNGKSKKTKPPIAPNIV